MDPKRRAPLTMSTNTVRNKVFREFMNYLRRRIGLKPSKSDQAHAQRQPHHGQRSA